MPRRSAEAFALREAVDLIGCNPGNRHAFEAAAIAADDRDGSSRNVQGRGKEFDERLVRGAVHRWRRDSYDQGAVTDAGAGGFLRSGNDTHVDGRPVSGDGDHSPHHFA